MLSLLVKWFALPYRKDVGLLFTFIMIRGKEKGGCFRKRPISGWWIT
jgi:hypothetical protein